MQTDARRSSPPDILLGHGGFVRAGGSASMNPAFGGASMTLLFACRRPAVIIGVLLSSVALAQTPDPEDWNAKFQATYVWQLKPSFAAAYSGVNSFSTQREKSYSFTATAALGMRPWSGGELYFDPEVAQGVPLSHLTGLGGFSNGEIARVSGSNPTFYRARLFLRH
jgi:hypothetical protein